MPFHPFGETCQNLLLFFYNQDEKNSIYNVQMFACVPLSKCLCPVSSAPTDN